jgi:site-specific DNA recombinase
MEDPHQSIRFAIYTRYSSDMQNEISLEMQKAMCREAIAKRGGTVIAVYSDSAKSGWSLDRESFMQMRQDAEGGLSDAIMFWKFDRFARFTQPLTISDNYPTK